MAWRETAQPSAAARRLLTAMTVCLAVLLTAVPAGAVSTLEDALVAAYNTNPQLLAERARQRNTDENVAQAMAGWRPTITAAGSYGVQESRSQFNTQTFGGVVARATSRTESRPIQGSITFNQPLFRGLRTINGVRQANSQVRAGRALLLNTEQEVLLIVVTAYMDVIRDTAVVKLSQNNVRVLERQLEAARDRFRVGEITRTDVAQAEARLTGARSNLTNADAQLTASRAAFMRAVGQAPGSLAEPPDAPAVPDAEESAVEMALAGNPVLAAAREVEKASRYGVKVEKGALLPTLSFEAQGLHQENGRFVGEQASSYTLEGQVTVPLYQAGAQSSRIRAAKAQNSEDRLRIIETERQVRESVAVAWEQLRATRAVIVSSREQVRANEIAFEGVQQEAQVGSRTTLDVLNAEQELLDSRVALVRAERNEYVATYGLLAAIGRLSAQALKLPVDYYDPTKNYRRVKWRPF